LSRQFRNSGRGHVPDDGIVDAAVVVNEAIAHSRDFLPLDRTELVAYFFGDSLGGFSNDLKASDEGALFTSSVMNLSNDVRAIWDSKKSASVRMFRRSSTIDGCIANGGQYDAGLSFS